MTITDGHQSWRMMITGNSRISFALAMDLADFQSELRSVQTLFTLTIPIALFLLATGGWLLAGQALRPIRKLTRVARQISAKDLHQRVPDSKADPEFEELINILNGMLDRLEASFQQATRFSADAAHELNTPLTILQGQIEQAIQNAPTEADQRVYAELLEEVQRLKNIVRKLLMIAKADTGQLKLNLERIDLSREIEDLLHDADVLAPGLKIERQLSPRIVVMADPDLLKQVLQNLLSNAIKYNRPEGVIQISLSHENGEARIRVGNTTPPGITIDDTLLFTRFYRGDSSRSRQIEGVGLGLSLSREIVHAHHGSLVLTESKEGWIAFTLTLPSLISQVTRNSSPTVGLELRDIRRLDTG
jgi:heavy metal sensor kinase